MKATSLTFLGLEKMIFDTEVQPRITQDSSIIDEYVKDLLEGAKFPPVIVFFDGTDHWLADGFSRSLAHQKAGRSEILAEIFEGGKRDAILYAVGSNATHGKRRSNDDKHRAVETLLKDEEWSKWSDRQIAKKCRVSQPFVSGIRKELTDSGYQFLATRKCSDGREMNVAPIGSNRSQGASQANGVVEKTSQEVQEKIVHNDLQSDAGTDPGSNPQLVTSEVESPGAETVQPDIPEAATEIQSNSSAISAPETEETAEVSAPIAEPESDDASEEDEAGVIVPNDVGTIADSESQEPEAITPQAEDDIPILKAKIAELEETLKAKDLELQEKEKIIESLDAKVWALEQDIEYYMQEMKAFEKEELAREPAFKSKPAFTEAMV